jgi:chemotaxis methyl-accepting protein methylase
MKTVICDICGEKMDEDTIKYIIKAKERKSTVEFERGMFFHSYYWDKIDVCYFCKNAIVELSKKNRKKIEE